MVKVKLEANQKPFSSYTRYLSIMQSGNCNIAYINNLRMYINMPEIAIGHILSSPPLSYGRFSDAEYVPAYVKPSVGIFIFAQGSEHPITKFGYACQFMQAIKYYELGRVISSGAVPNLRHGGKDAYTYMWLVNHKACRRWWVKNIKKRPTGPKSICD